MGDKIVFLKPFTKLPRVYQVYRVYQGSLSRKVSGAESGFCRMCIRKLTFQGTGRHSIVAPMTPSHELFVLYCTGLLGTLENLKKLLKSKSRRANI